MLITLALSWGLSGQIIVPPQTPIRTAKMQYNILKVTAKRNEDGSYGEPLMTPICSGIANIDVVNWGGGERRAQFLNPSDKALQIHCDSTLNLKEGLKIAELKLRGMMGIWTDASETRFKSYSAVMDLILTDIQTQAREVRPYFVANTVSDINLKQLSGFLTPPSWSAVEMTDGREVLVATVDFIDEE